MVNNALMEARFQVAMQALNDAISRELEAKTAVALLTNELQLAKLRIVELEASKRKLRR